MSELMGPTVTITQQEYAELLIAADKLRRLENGGVDNWEWYGESLRSSEDDEQSHWDYAESLKCDAMSGTLEKQ